jgi:hypothetical protein
MEFLHPLAFALVGESSRQLARSALPDAPVVPDGPPPSRPTRHRTRRRVALTLHRLADRLQPA